MQSRAYTYTKAGDVAGITDYLSGITRHYTYDALHRLTSETMTGNVPDSITDAHILTFEDYSNGPVHGVNTIAINGMINSDVYDYAYDESGNMTSAPDFTDPENPAIRTISWNADGMPTTIDHSAHGATAIVYDGDGARAIKINGDHDTYYVTGTFQVQEDNGATANTTKHIMAGSNRIAVIKTIGTVDTRAWGRTKLTNRLFAWCLVLVGSDQANKLE
ncbi:MAG: RHS repeat domain-containing protein [Thermodesulfobacteriota bacterium]|nr:RHS repeat domain-containing protein [Thermodesulfobacteriota bacterium]